MKVLKVLAIILVVVIGLYFVLAAVSPSHLELEKTETINAPASAVIAHVQCMDKWRAWSAWDKMDPDMVNTYSENPCGPGAWNSWDGPQTGKGKQTIEEIVGEESIKMSLVFDGFEGTNYANWKFEEADGVTTVTWDYKGAESSFMTRPMNLMVKGVLEESYSSGLAALKEVVESSPVEETVYDITETTVPAGGVLLISADVKPEDISEFYGRSYGKILGYMADQEVEMRGYPSGFFYNWTDTLAKMSAAIGVKSPADGNREIEYRELEEQKALKIDYYGPFNGTEMAHYAMDDYMTENNLEMAGAVIEVYVTDPTEEPDTSKWLTKIIYPIK